jgi:hypothetical protein
MGSFGDEVRSSLVLGTFAAIAVVLLVPVLVRGDWVQRVLAGVLLILPALQLTSTFLVATGLARRN